MNKSDISFECVPFHEIGHEVAKNMKAHYESLDKNEKYDPINADWKAYLDLSKLGLCVAFIAKKNNAIIAYSIFIIDKNINHKNILEAQNTAMYIWPEYRAKITFKFFKWIHRYLLDSSIKEINYMIKSPRIGKLFKRMGLQPTHILWTLKNE